MKTASVFLTALLLAACGKSASTDTVENLVANPDRLSELREQCKTNRAKLGDAQCDAVAEATRRRFMGDGSVPYTPPTEQPKF
ncbi:MAG: EexN family lipoprotein [Gammaproteobacteria bacterium]|nr:EexN family lipoprotein [Gammaproteobacteria bacterium]